MKFLFAFIIALPISIIWFWSSIFEPYLKIEYDYVDIKSSELFDSFQGLKIAVLSDIHYANAPSETWKLNRIIQKTNELNPDIVVLLGDYVNAATPFGFLRLDILTHNLKKLRAPMGVFAVMGNHDSYYGLSVVKKSVADANISILENSNVEIKTPRGPFYLAGVPDALTQNYYFLPTFKNIPDDKPAILLSHSPDLFRDMPRQSKIMLSGHTHGGQIKLPKLGAILVNLQFEKIAEGKLEKRGQTLYVTRGLGMSRIPVRLFTTPSIAIVTISK